MNNCITLDILINKLQELKNIYGGNIPIIKESSNYELSQALQLLEYINPQVYDIEKKIKTFKDDFDGYYYNSEICEIQGNVTDKSIKVLKLF